MKNTLKTYLIKVLFAVAPLVSWLMESVVTLCMWLYKMLCYAAKGVWVLVVMAILAIPLLVYSLRGRSRKFYIRCFLIPTTIGVGSIFLLILLIYLGVFGTLPTKQDLKDLRQAEASLIYDCNEEFIGKFYIFDRTKIEYKDFPPYLINALIATEDERFYEHSGVDIKSLFRVFFKTLLLQDDSSGGGSTLTMQLAKNLFGREQRYGKLTMPVHKLKEMIIARRIEKVYSKEEIIALYLNTVPFSDNTYGIESASWRFFSKPARELTLNEAATLIGTLKANHN